MTLDEAVAAATRRLHEMQRPDLPLRLGDPEKSWSERSWCYVFGFNSVEFLEHGTWEAFLPTGALVVPKDGAEPWVMPSSRPTDQLLDEYEREHGLT